MKEQFTRLSIFIFKHFDSLDDVWHSIIIILGFTTRLLPINEILTEYGFVVENLYWAMLGQFLMYLGKIRMPDVFGINTNHKIGTLIMFFLIDMIFASLCGLFATPWFVADAHAKTTSVVGMAILSGAFYELILKEVFKFAKKKISKLVSDENQNKPLD